MKIYLAFLALLFSSCAQIAEKRFDPSKLSPAELSKLTKVKDSANRECYEHEMGAITLYINLGPKPTTSMKNQLIALYVKNTNNRLTPANALVYKSMVKTWSEQNMDTLTAAYLKGTDLIPGHMYVGVKPRYKREKQWHFLMDKDAAGKAPAKIVHTTDTYTHIRTYKAGPETIRRINEFLANAKNDVPYYHWNADQVRTLYGKRQSNCVVFAVDAVKYAGIDTSDIEHVRDPWDLTSKFTPKAKR